MVDEKQVMISVIIPVYNSEKYLHKCIDSVLAQSYTNFELILVNDGSTDGSGEICDEYAEKDERVRVFHKENGGASSARNLGIDNAKGEYICFVDSDDWVEPQYLNDFLIGDLEKDKSLVIQTNIYYEYTNEPHKSIWRFTDYEQENYQGAEIIKALTLSNFFVSKDGGPVGKLFKKKVLDHYNIRFLNNISAYEDVVFSLKYVSNINQICISKGKNYHYLHRESQISLSRVKHPYHEYLISADEGEKALNYLFERFKYKDELIISFVKTLMAEIRLASINALYSCNIVIEKKKRLRLLNSLKKSNIILSNNSCVFKNKNALVTQILFFLPIYVADYLYLFLFRFRNILNKNK